MLLQRSMKRVILTCTQRTVKIIEDFLSWAATIANRKCFAYLKKDRDLLVDEQTDDEGRETDFFESIADDESFIPADILFIS